MARWAILPMVLLYMAVLGYEMHLHFTFFSMLWRFGTLFEFRVIYEHCLLGWLDYLSFLTTWQPCLLSYTNSESMLVVVSFAAYVHY